MLSSSGSGAIHASYASKTYHKGTTYRSAVSQPANSNYDSSSFSAISDQTSRFQMDTVSRLTQEIRTVTTTGKIQNLRQSVSSGEYTPDPAEIAKRMMLAAEE